MYVVMPGREITLKTGLGVAGTVFKKEEISGMDQQTVIDILVSKQAIQEYKAKSVKTNSVPADEL